MEITDKKVVKLHYTGTLSDGTTFDSSEGKEPLEFMFGSGMIIPGLEEGIKGLKVGDKKTVQIPSEKAYGPVMEEAKQVVPKEQLPTEVELKEGMQLAAQGPHGVIPVTIAKIEGDQVTVDFNHPLAGKDLTFEVEITDIREATEEELAHGHNHTEDGCCGGGSCSSEDGEDKECCGSGQCHK